MKSRLKSTVAILRNDLGLGVDKFAKLLGVSVWAVQRLERNDLKLSVKLAHRIQEATGASAEWLLANNTEIRNYQCLSARERRVRCYRAADLMGYT